MEKFKEIEAKALAGNYSAMSELANYYIQGNVVEKNIEEGINWYEKAIKAGDDFAPQTVNDIGYNLQVGQNGYEVNLSLALRCYKIAADAGNVLGMGNYAYCNYCGTGTEKNYQTAYEYWQKAADKGDAVCMNNVGFCYENGYGVEQDLAKSIEYYFNALENKYAGVLSPIETFLTNHDGFSDYMYKLGEMYYNGKSVEMNWDKAVEWFVKASKRNYEARRILGLMYKTGNGVTKDLKEALRWYEMAGEERIVAEIKQSDDWKRLTAKESEESVDVTDAQAMCQLAMQYQYGENNMPKDRDKAIFWYQKSAMAGNSAALSFLNMLLSEKEAERADMQRREEDNRLAEMQRMLEAERRAMAERNAKEEAERRAKEEASGKLTVNGFEYLGRYTIYCSYEHSEWYYDKYMNRSREHKEKIWDTLYAENEDDKNAKVDVYMKPVGGSIIYRVKGSTGKIYQISRGNYQTKTGFALESKETYAYDEIPKAIYEYETFNSKYINCHGVEIRLNV